MKSRQFANLRFGLCLLAGTYCFAQSGGIQIQVEEWRDKPVRHLYIRGNWNGDTAFQVMLPEGPLWKGRLFHYLQGGNGGNENAGVQAGEHLYALANGAAYVESSQGHLGGGIWEENTTPRKIMYEANYAVVQYAKIRCVELYHREPAHTYVYGASGGAVRSSDLVCRFPKVYDGAVAEEGAGEQRFLWYLHSVYEMYRPLIQDKAAAIGDQIRVGGSGDPYRITTPAQKEALRQILFAGFPRNGIVDMQPSPAGVGLMDFVKYKVDPDYYVDFWKQAGYPGADGELRSELVDGLEGQIKEVTPQGVRTDVERPDRALYGYTLVLTSGAAAGQWRRIADSKGSLLILNGLGPGSKSLAAGDRFRLDNRDLLAWRYFHRYIVMPEEPVMKAWFVDGHPKYPQRSAERLNSWQEPEGVGRIQGKLIAMFGQNDPGVWPTMGFRYLRQVRSVLGNDIDNHFRLHFMEHTVHGGGGRVDWEVSWRTVEHKAMDDVVRWVEQNIPPQPGTRFTISDDNQLILPKTAAERQGYQPVVSVRANGKAGVVEVAKGQEVRFDAEAEDPVNEITRFEIDFEGDNKFDESTGAQGKRQATAFHHAYDKPGTYFAAVRVTDSTKSIGITGPGIQNLANIRVIVK